MIHMRHTIEELTLMLNCFRINVIEFTIMRLKVVKEHNLPTSRTTHLTLEKLVVGVEGTAF